MTATAPLIAGPNPVGAKAATKPGTLDLNLAGRMMLASGEPEFSQQPPSLSLANPALTKRPAARPAASAVAVVACRPAAAQRGSSQTGRADQPYLRKRQEGSCHG